MSNPLLQKLEGLDDKDRDQQLLRVWKEFQDTDAYHALNYLMSQLEQVADSEILNPHTSDSRRTFAAGEKHLLITMRNSMEMIRKTDPDALRYDDDNEPTSAPSYTEDPPPPMEEDYTAKRRK